MPSISIDLSSSSRVLIGIENGSVDVICSIRNSNFLVLNDTRLYLEYQSLTNDEPIIREYDLTKEDLNFGKIIDEFRREERIR